MNSINNKHKYFCDQCSKIRYGVKTFCSFDKHRDYTNHLCIAKHKRNIELLEQDPNSIVCETCSKYFSVEGYKVHKERNERLWSLKKILGNNYLTCNRFQWDADSKLFSSMSDLIEHRNNPVISSASKQKTPKEKGLVNTFSYLKSNQNKSIEQKEEEIEKQLKDEEKYEQCPDLELCVDCSNHSKKYYFNPEGFYTGKHLSLFNMEDCGCRYED